METKWAGEINDQIAAALRLDVQEWCVENGCTQMEAAEVIGVGESTLCNYLDGRRPLHAGLLVRVSRKLGKTRALRRLGILCGGDFVTPVAVRRTSAPVAIRATAQVAKEAGEAVSAVLEDLKDGRLDNFAGAAAEIEDAIGALRTLAVVLQGMAGNQGERM